MMKTWEAPGDPTRRCKKGESMFARLCGDYLLDHPRGAQPECLRVARSRAHALANLPFHPGMCGEFWGGPATTHWMPYAIAALPREGRDDKASLAAYHDTTRSFKVGANHTIPDYRTLVDQGLGDFIRRAGDAFQRDPSPCREAMLISLKAVSDYLRRAAAFCRPFHPACAARLEKIATERPETFAEGVQLVMTIHDLLTADNGGANALGRLDQYLFPLYVADASGRGEALDALCHLFVAVDRYHDITNIAIGGMTPDGANAENALSLLILEAVGRVHSPSTNLSARLHDQSGDAFLRGCVKLIATGIGFPAVFNDHVNVPMLVGTGIPVEAARDYALVGCVETVVPGRQVPWSDGRFNMPEIFCSLMRRLEDFDSYEALWSELSRRLAEGLRAYQADYDAALAARPAADYPMPLLSALVSDCIARGLDVNGGGAEFPRFHGIGMMGLATLADSLAVVKKLVFEEKRIPARRLVEALERDFEGDETLRQVCLNHAPKYGNDDPYVDAIAADIVRLASHLSADLRSADGGRLLSCMASNVQNVSAGAATPATPDGRHAKAPLSDAASPSAGRDREGPTAFVNSIVKPDYATQNCTVVNMRFAPAMFQGEAGVARMVALLRRFVAGRGHEMQFNVTDNGVLERAMERPEEFGDLIVRVSGFSDYFVNLAPEVQRDILRRSLHGVA